MLRLVYFCVNYQNGQMQSSRHSQNKLKFKQKKTDDESIRLLGVHGIVKNRMKNLSWLRITTDFHLGYSSKK